MISFALAKGDAVKAMEIFWKMPLKDVWSSLWCYYQYNDVKIKRVGSEDLGAIM
jgi:hypothetical protein